MEFHSFLVQAISSGSVSLSRSLETCLGIDIDTYRQIRLDSVARDFVKLHHHISTKLAPPALIGQRGIRKSIAEHNRPVFPSRQYSLIDVLGSSGEVQEHLRHRAKVLIVGVEKNRPDLASDLGAPRFLGFYDLTAG